MMPECGEVIRMGGLRPDVVCTLPQGHEGDHVSVEWVPRMISDNPVPVSTGSVFTCEAVICKRATDGGTPEFRAILSDNDHVMMYGKHYHLHCAPPIEAGPEEVKRIENELNQPGQDTETEGETVGWLIERVTSIVQEAPQAEREPLLYRAHVLGVLHQAKAMERIADILEAIEVYCSELVKPSPHEFLAHTAGGKNCYVCGLTEDHECHHGKA